MVRGRRERDGGDGTLTDAEGSGQEETAPDGEAGRERGGDGDERKEIGD